MLEGRAMVGGDDNGRMFKKLFKVEL